MKIGILQADSVVDQFQPRHGNYPGMIESILAKAAKHVFDETWQYETYDVEHNQYPETTDACDGYVITGSKKSVYDNEAWIHRLKDYVVTLHTERKRVVGLCFGHQLIADALGGQTRSAEVGWGVGIHRSEVVNRPWFMDEEVSDYSLIVR